jgi:hypothetical protein
MCVKPGLLVATLALSAGTAFSRGKKDDLAAEPVPGKITQVACHVVDKTEQIKAYSGTSEDANRADMDATYRYRVYLPEDYAMNASQRYPCFFIAMPGGNARMGALDGFLRRNRWIVVMLVESKNGTPDWFPNFLAAHDDAVKRFRILDDYKFATGVSGGARCCSSYPELRDGFAGLLLQAASFGASPALAKTKDGYSHLAVVGTFGDKDYNFKEVDLIRRQFQADVPVRNEVFEGKHGGAPRDVATRSIEWLERKVFVESRIPRKDRALAAKWCYDNTRAALGRATSPAEKALLLRKLLKVAENGLASSDAKGLTGYRNEFAKFADDATAAKELAAARGIDAVADEIAVLDRLMRRSRGSYRSRKVADDEYQAVGRVLSGYQLVAMAYPTTVAGRFASASVGSLRLEFGDKGLQAALHRMRTAASRQDWRTAIIAAVEAKAWAVSSDQAADADGVLDRAEKVGRKQLVEVGNRPQTLRAFIDAWSPLPCAIEAREKYGELGVAELAKATSSSGSRRKRALKELLDGWQGYPVYPDALAAFEKDAAVELERIRKMTNSFARERALRSFAKEWSPAPSARTAVDVLCETAREKLAGILKHPSAYSRRSKLKSFMKSYEGLPVADEAKAALDAMRETEARKEYERIVSRYKASSLRSKLTAFLRKYAGTSAAVDAKKALAKM